MWRPPRNVSSTLTRDWIPHHGKRLSCSGQRYLDITLMAANNSARNAFQHVKKSGHMLRECYADFEAPVVRGEHKSHKFWMIIINHLLVKIIRGQPIVRTPVVNALAFLQLPWDPAPQLATCG